MSRTSHTIEDLALIYHHDLGARKTGHFVRNAQLVNWPATTQKTRQQAQQAILGKINLLLDEFVLNIRGDEDIVFKIGKTGVHRSQRYTNFDPNDVKTWKYASTNIGSIGSRWTDYQKEGYNAIIPLVAITKERVPASLYPVISQERYAFDLEEDLQLLVRMSDHGARCENKSPYSRGSSSTTVHVGYIIYLAIKIVKKKQDEASEEEIDEVSDNDDAVSDNDDEVSDNDDEEEDINPKARPPRGSDKPKKVVDESDDEEDKPKKKINLRKKSNEKKG
jgi:hypothetical protein